MTKSIPLNLAGDSDINKLADIISFELMCCVIEKHIAAEKLEDAFGEVINEFLSRQSLPTLEHEIISTACEEIKQVLIGQIHDCQKK